MGNSYLEIKSLQGQEVPISFFLRMIFGTIFNEPISGLYRMNRLSF